MVISADKDVEDYFDMADVNNELYMKIYWAVMKGWLKGEVEE